MDANYGLKNATAYSFQVYLPASIMSQKMIAMTTLKKIYYTLSVYMSSYSSLYNKLRLNFRLQVLF